MKLSFPFVAALFAASAAAFAQVADPVFQTEPDGRLTLSCPTQGSVIRYTFENKEPEKDAGVYLAPIIAPSGRVVRARAFSADGTQQSGVAQATGEDEKTKGLATSLLEVTQNRDWRNYDWAKRHAAVIALIGERKPALIFIGDSITHFFGGEPRDARQRGADVWEKSYGPRNAANLGYGWDRTENVLWRLRHGELDGAAPKVVVLMIGTNNIGLNPPDEIAAGVRAICDELHTRVPSAKLLVLGIFPRGAKPDDGSRAKIANINAQLAKLDGTNAVTFLDIGKTFLAPDESISPEIMNDYLHPTPKGYQLWADAMEPTLRRLLGEPAL